MSNIKKSELDAYGELERHVGQKIAGKLLDPYHTIQDATAIYPEYALREPFGLHRPGVNLGALLFLYRQVVVYVPPMTRSEFPQRFGITYEVFLELSNPRDEMGRFIFPVLNHPRKYRDALYRDQLGDLLRRMPPTWERWHSALNVAGARRWFDEADVRFHYPGMWSLPDLRDMWRNRLKTNSEAVVSREIKQQIRNNYTDLCLVNRGDMANDIATLSHSDPVLAVNDLWYSSDLYAYPWIMGAGGYANVRAHGAARVVRSGQRDMARVVPREMQYFDTGVVEAMLEGLRFHAIPRVFRLQFLEQWHCSSQAEKARQAFKKLLEIARAGQRTPDLEELHRTMKIILTELQDFCERPEASSREVEQKAARQQTKIAQLTIAGGITASIVGIFTLNVLMVIAGGSLGIIGYKKWTDRERIIKKLLERHAPNVPWDLYNQYRDLREFPEKFWRRWRALPESVEVKERSSATSVPVQTLWWNER